MSESELGHETPQAQAAERPTATRGGAAPGAPGTARAKVALLVGIDRYAPGTSRDFKDLDGCLNDVRAARELLAERFAFADEDIVLLENEQATHQAIVAAFVRGLIERSGAQTEAVFWFSGHGSRVPDKSGVPGAEPDGLDSTLLAYDSRAEGRNGSYDLCDDELSALLAALRERTERITVVTDCCHSGGVMRSARREAAKVRAAPPGNEPFDPELVAEFWPRTVALEDDRSAPQPPPYVHIAACSPRQVAHEYEDKDFEGGSRFHGALTFSLIETLQALQRGKSYRRVADEASQFISTHFPDQTVWYEGPLEREWFSGTFDDRPAGCLARRRSDGKLLLPRGAIQGIRKGSKLDLFDALTSEPAGGAVVERVLMTSSLAHFEGDPPAGRGALYAVEASRPAALDPTPLVVEDPRVAEQLASDADFELVPHVESASDGSTGRALAYRLALDPSLGRYVLFAPPDSLRFWIEDDESAKSGPEERPGRVATAISRQNRDNILRFRAIHALAQLEGSLSVRAQFESPSEKDLADWKAIEGFADAGLERCRSETGAAANEEFMAIGQSSVERRCVMLSVTSEDDEPLHVAVISVAEDRSTNLIWPPKGNAEDFARLAPGATRRIPVYVVLQEEWPLERPMRDRYVVLATREFADFSAFENTSGQLRGSEQRLQPLVALAVARPTLRSPTPVPLEPSEFGVEVIDLLVRRP